MSGRRYVVTAMDQARFHAFQDKFKFRCIYDEA